MEVPLRRRRARYKGPAAPPWKEIYRRRCMERLRSSRAKLLDRYRQAGKRVCSPAMGALLVQEVMEQEWQTLQAAQESLPSLRGKEALVQVQEDPDELAVLEEIRQELILQEQLVIEEYERSLQFDEECLNAMLDGLDASDKVICPVCRKNNLTVRNHLVFCQCGLYISTQGMTEGKLRSLLESTVTEHSHRCFHNPEFTVTSGMEEEASLLMICPVSLNVTFLERISAWIHSSISWAETTSPLIPGVCVAVFPQTSLEMVLPVTTSNCKRKSQIIQFTLTAGLGNLSRTCQTQCLTLLIPQPTTSKFCVEHLLRSVTPGRFSCKLIWLLLFLLEGLQDYKSTQSC